MGVALDEVALLSGLAVVLSAMAVFLLEWRFHQLSERLNRLDNDLAGALQAAISKAIEENLEFTAMEPPTIAEQFIGEVLKQKFAPPEPPIEIKRDKDGKFSGP